ncbi:hypothetical protein CBS101457_000305 [Exobasidium rhododendri]|nr:hypothetical protein CBS101457_000305 [Exobasidium rhododendri]
MDEWDNNNNRYTNYRDPSSAAGASTPRLGIARNSSLQRVRANRHGEQTSQQPQTSRLHIVLQDPAFPRHSPSSYVGEGSRRERSARQDGGSAYHVPGHDHDSPEAALLQAQASGGLHQHHYAQYGAHQATAQEGQYSGHIDPFPSRFRFEDMNLSSHHPPLPDLNYAASPSFPNLNTPASPLFQDLNTYPNEETLSFDDVRDTRHGAMADEAHAMQTGASSSSHLPQPNEAESEYTYVEGEGNQAASNPASVWSQTREEVRQQMIYNIFKETGFSYDVIQLMCQAHMNKRMRRALLSGGREAILAHVPTLFPGMAIKPAEERRWTQNMTMAESNAVVDAIANASLQSEAMVRDFFWRIWLSEEKAWRILHGSAEYDREAAREFGLIRGDPREGSMGTRRGRPIQRPWMEGSNAYDREAVLDKIARCTNWSRDWTMKKLKYANQARLGLRILGASDEEWRHYLDLLIEAREA